MPDTRPNWPAKLPTSLISLAIATALLFLTGCKQSGEDSYSSSAQAAPLVAEKREASALSAFRSTFGDSSQAGSQEVTSAPSSGSSLPTDSSDTTVTPPSSYQPERPTLSWSPPLTRENGDSLYMSEITGYRVRFRMRHQSSFQSMEMNGADNTTLPLDFFEPGAYEFSVSVVDSQGLESQPSDLIAVDLI
ncbi:fibronectin type III domain-containing protein [Marinobacter zhejiangensis]|uniref:Fibronectin type-III domain-containing protein n=1 Tax=Marinobacter zhejiangensis TaxID=488535 RepID=A0A1I4MG40_9GAMM|nr:fibronectin type III domain-containing protein [Marinobacter zhejiangensis]SFM02211.1 hypothetical protein SAMN04487963_1064 [Marinobacter zhejiangensis]